MADVDHLVELGDRRVEMPLVWGKVTSELGWLAVLQQLNRQFDTGRL